MIDLTITDLANAGGFTATIAAGSTPGPSLFGAKVTSTTGSFEISYDDVFPSGGTSLPGTVAPGLWAFFAMSGAGVDFSNVVIVQITDPNALVGRTINLRWEPGGGGPQTIEAAHGEDLLLLFTPPTATSITAYSLRFTAAKSFGDAATVTKTEGLGVTVVSASAGTFTVALPAATFAEAGEWVWEVERTDAGAVTRLAWGYLVIVDDVR